MHADDTTRWRTNHDFNGGNPLGEKGTRRVMLLTAVMMIAEIIAGLLFNSMALLADGWHMGTHVAALGITAFTYWYARRCATDTRFTFGTWKVGVLGGFASAIFLGLVAVYMAWESLVRLWNPLPIQHEQAIIVAIIGLAVNLLSAFLLQNHHGHEEGHGHHHGHAHGDLNLRAAYLHVLADALTSVLAIVALVGGKFLRWDWLDPAMGIVGAAVITHWAVGLLRQTSRVLLDCEMDAPVVQEIKECIEADGDAIVVDQHVWRVAPAKYACIVSLVAAEPASPVHYKERLSIHEELAHVTVEIHRCEGEHPHADTLGGSCRGV